MPDLSVKASISRGFFKPETEGFEPSCRDEPTNAFRVRRVTAASLRLHLVT